MEGEGKEKPAGSGVQVHRQGGDLGDPRVYRAAQPLKQLTSLGGRLPLAPVEFVFQKHPPQGVKYRHTSLGLAEFK